ncbi:UDP-N-acetylmuramoyl-L-alanine--D-glutamate ligase [Gudongella sp. SC589]|jgi:UDP-N-acetylmuramoylalanine--D-glutamate ligase|uniref:UDP-N-acetylmuramoyl-L-alanine--D-glutamate ligase n=1 Tax=Gudongella sp. SC589 TaxID=3385990 RepID=UPI003904C094
MLIKGKKILVMGIGITGISAIKMLMEHNNELMVYDEKSKEEIIELLHQNEIDQVAVVDDESKYLIQEVDFVVKSPGIPPDHHIIEFAEDKDIPVISDIELAFNVGIQGTVIGITGTNGKTTSTMLAGEILKKAGIQTHLAGNMGTGILQVVEKVKQEDYIVLELSSFQLEHTYLFRPQVALITNITEDHLDWHGSFENYMASKFKIFSNQSADNHLILNWDDKHLRGLKDKVRPEIIWFSTQEELEEGIYLKDDSIIYRMDGAEETILELADIKIPGLHNIENVCGVVGIMKALKIDNGIIRESVRCFKGVEHRIEFIQEKNGISYYNDSKGTNVQSTLKAIQAMVSPVVLIAGGYDKGADYGDLTEALVLKCRALILMGETAEKIRKSAEENGISEIYKVKNMEEAVRTAATTGMAGDAVLLSPACASWDMYRNFEERGKHFKRIVMELTE